MLYYINYQKSTFFLFERLGSPTGSSTRPHARYKAATATGMVVAVTPVLEPTAEATVMAAAAV